MTGPGGNLRVGHPSPGVVHPPAGRAAGPAPPRRLLPLLGTVAVLVVLVAALAWSVPYARTATALARFERELPTEQQTGTAQQGSGLLGLDVVTLDDGRVVQVHRQGPPRVQWPRPTYLVGSHGARLADEPASAGAWRAFGLRVATAWAAALVLAVTTLPWLMRRLPGAVDHLAFVVHGQRDPRSPPITFIAGSGSHGGAGGQVPPLVPYSPAWDPDRRIP